MFQSNQKNQRLIGLYIFCPQQVFIKIKAMESEPNLPLFSKVKDLETAQSQKNFNLHVKLVSVSRVKTELLEYMVTVGTVADQTGCIDVQFKQFDQGQLKEGLYLTIVDCQFPKNLSLKSVKLKISAFFQTQQENLKPKNINLENNLSFQIQKKYNKQTKNKKPENFSQPFEQTPNKAQTQESKNQLQKNQASKGKIQSIITPEQTKKQNQSNHLNENEQTPIEKKKTGNQESTRKNSDANSRIKRYQDSETPSGDKPIGVTPNKNTKQKTIKDENMSKQQDRTFNGGNLQQNDKNYIQTPNGKTINGLRQLRNQELKEKQQQQNDKQMRQIIKISKLQAELEDLKRSIPYKQKDEQNKILFQMNQISSLIDKLSQQLVEEAFQEQNQIIINEGPFEQHQPSRLIGNNDQSTNLIVGVLGILTFPISAPIYALYNLFRRQPQRVIPLKPSKNMHTSKSRLKQSAIKLGFKQLQNQKLIYTKVTRNEKNGQQKFKNYAKIYSQDNSTKQKGQSKYNLKDLSDEKIWDIIEKASEQSPQICHLMCDEVMEEPITQEIKKASDKLKGNYAQIAKKRPQSFANMLHHLVKILQGAGISVIMTQKSTIQSKISMRILTGQLNADSVKVESKIQDQDPQFGYKFNDLYCKDKMEKFTEMFKQKVSEETKINPQNIYISQIVKGSIKVIWITDEGEKLDKQLEDRPQLKKKLKLNKYFEYFHLSPEDFDIAGNIQFQKSNKSIDRRGGWPYYPPVKCKRYGIRVSKKYDNGDDRWLEMNGRSGEWVVAFHGVRQPRSFCQAGNKKKSWWGMFKKQRITISRQEPDNSGDHVLNSIMKGRESGNMLRPGSEQEREHDIVANNESRQRVGQGIYCTPHIQQAFAYTNEQKQEFGLIFQCRVNPKHIKVCSRVQQYWVINLSKNIRPYGIILIKDDIMRKSYPKVEDQYGRKFSYALDMKKSDQIFPELSE